MISDDSMMIKKTLLQHANASTLYVLLDASADPSLFPFLKTINVPITSLLPEPLDDEMRKVAPYLVLANDELVNFLLQQQFEWGFYFSSNATLRELRAHLRHYLEVNIPDQQEAVFFRFYDPRNIEMLCEQLSDWDLHQFLGPIECLFVPRDHDVIELDFAARRGAFPVDVAAHQRPLSFNEAQMAQITAHFEARYTQNLATLMQKWSGKKESDFALFAQDLFCYLKMLGICDDRLQRAIAKYCIDNDFDNFTALPREMKDQLSSLDYTPNLVAKRFLIKELGRVPFPDELC